METAALQVTIKTDEARADLIALGKAFDRVGTSFNNLDKKFGQAAANIDRDANKAVKGFDKVARVAALLGKIKVNTASVDAIRQFTTAIDGLGRARVISDQKINNLRRFLVLASTVKAPTGINGLAQFMSVLSTVRAPTQATVSRLQAFFATIQQFKPPANSQTLANLFATFGAIRVPSQSQITRLQSLLTVLNGAKNISGAASIARDLDMIAASAGRAGNAINNMPGRMRNMGVASQQAHGQVTKLSGGVKDLNNRLSLGYQAGTLFTTMFSTFTIGAFFRDIWKTNIEMAKLEKSMLFATGSMKGQEQATGQAIAMFQRLGMRIDVAADSYARFAISSTAAGFSIEKTQKIFGAVGQALQVVGASSQQVEYAMYGLTQMMQKGKVSSEEFNRQIGEQLPGNAAVGARALSKLMGRRVEVAEFFDMMAKGQIQSNTFAPAWAEELDKMYAPLRELVDLRPDVALNRLKNAFSLFTLEIGKSGLMAGLGKTFGDLTGRFLEEQSDGTIALSANAKKLADQWGANLAKAAMTLGRAVGFIADNLDTVIGAVKGLIALRLGATMFSWGNGAKEAAAGLFSFTNATATATAAKRGNPAALGAAYSGAMFGPAGSSPGQAAAIAQRNRMQAGGFRSGMNAAVTGMALNPAGSDRNRAGFRAGQVLRSPLTVMAAGASAAGKGISTAANTAGNAISGMTARAVGSISVFGAMRGALNMLGPAALVAGVALAAFGDKTTEVQNKMVTFNDIASGTFKLLGEDITKWWNDSAKAFDGWGNDSKKAELSAGELTATILANFITLAQGIFDIATSIGEIIGTILLGPMESVIYTAGAMAAAMRGNFEGAGKLLAEIAPSSQNNWKELGDTLGTRINEYFSGQKFQNNYDRISGNAAESAQNRANGDAELAALMERNAKAATDAADRVAAQQEADRQATEQGRRESVLRSLSVGPAGEIGDFSTFMTEWREAASGLKTAAEAQQEAAKAQTTAATAATATGGAAAAATATPGKVPEWFVRSIIQQESNNRPGLEGPQTKYGRAYGLMQMLDGTGAATARKHGVAWNPALMRARTDEGRAYQEQMGRLHLGDLSEKYNGNLEQVALAYHGGTDTRLWGPKTHRYNVDVLGRGGMQASGTAAGSQRPDVREGLTGYQRRRDGEAWVRGAADIGQNGAAGSSAGMTAASAEDIMEKGTRMRDVYERLVGSDPSRAAESQYNRFRVDVQQIRDQWEELRGLGAEINWVDFDQIAAAEKRMRQLKEDGQNPLGKMNREMEESNELQALRASGATEEASWAEKLLDLKREGRTIEEATLTTERARFDAGRARTEQLQSQLELTEAMNRATVSSIGRNGSAYDRELASLISSRTVEGESYDQTRARLTEQKAMGGLEASARATDQERLSGAKQSIERELAELTATSRLRGRQRDQHDNYKTYLEELTGLTGRTTAELEAQSPQLAAYAQSLASMRESLENPPGFQRWADSLQPLSERLEDIKGEFMSGLAGGLTDAFMGEKVDWGAIAKNITKKMMAAQIEESLGALVRGMGARRDARQAANNGTLPSAANDNKLPGAANVERPGGFWGKVRSIFMPQQQPNGREMSTEEKALRAFELVKGGEETSFSTTKDAQAQAVGAMTVNAQTVTINAQSVTGGAGGAAGGFDPKEAARIAKGLNDPKAAARAAKGLSVSGDVGVKVSTQGGAAPTGGTADAGAAAGGGGFMSGLKSMGGDFMSGLKSMFGSLTGGGGEGGGFMSGLKSMGGDFLSSGKDFLATTFGGGKDEFVGGMGSMLGGVNMVLDMLGIGMEEVEKPHVAKPVNGLIGAMGGVTTEGTAIAAKSNPWATAINMGLDMATGGQYSKFANLGNMIGSTAARFHSEGGYANQAMKTASMPLSAFAGAPRYREGTENTDGIPAILHPNEAVIPLSRGRKIPVEMGNAGGSTTNVNNFNIAANDPNEFRSAEASIQRRMNKAQRRSQLRNLS